MRKLIGLLLGCLMLLVGCANSQPGASTSPKDSVQPGFPVTVKSCGKDITLTKKPQRIMVMNTVGLAALDELGDIGLVAAYTGTLDRTVLSKSINDALDHATRLEGQKMDSGGSIMSTEAILDARVDLVLGYDSGVDRESLAKAGIPFYSPDAFCPGYTVDKASFDLVYHEVDTIAALVGKSDEAATVNDRLAKSLPSGATPSSASPSGKPGNTAAALYITAGVEKIWGYGRSSMLQPIMNSNGLTNVYQDQPDRVPEISAEDLIKRDPKTLIILYGEGNPEDARKTFLAHKGVQAMQAVRNGRVILMPFALSDPPSPLSVQGAVYLRDALAKLG